jgi:glutamine synthetase
MFANADEMFRYIEEEAVEFVDIRFCDLPGIMQHFTVPVSSFDASVLEDGLMFDGSSIRGFQAIHESDMALFPDVTTAYLDSFRERKTLCLNFFIHDPLTGEAYSRDPRNIARKAENYLKSTGIGDTAFFAPEAEFYVFDDVRSRPSRTPATTRSTPWPAPGTPVVRRSAATRATRSATRAATSPSARSTTSPTCART